MSDVPFVFPNTEILDQPWLERLDSLRAKGSAPETLGPYRLLHLLGRGGMSSVYLAERADGRFDRRVAVKLLDAGFTLSREAGALAKLDHPNIARILDAGCAPDGRHFLVLQFVEGQSLAAATLASPEAIALCFLDLARALAHAHDRGILHRDIKPSNVLIGAAGRPVLIDFSAATEAHPHSPDSTKTMYRAWTPSFASPEQLAGESGTEQSDIYSLGLLLRGVLNAKDPSPLELDLRSIAEKASEELPELRYGAALEVAKDLESALRGQPLLARQPRRHLAWASRLRRHPFGVGLIVLAFAVAACVWLAAAQRNEREMNRRVRALFSIASPSVSDSSAEDPNGLKASALLVGIEEWSKLRDEFGPRPEIMEGLFIVTVSYGQMLLGPTGSRVENLPRALPYLHEAVRLSDHGFDSRANSPKRACEIAARRLDARMALANAHLAGGDWESAESAIESSRSALASFPRTELCHQARDVHSLELEAVSSRVLFAQRRWDELIPLRRDLLRRREALVERAREAKLPSIHMLRMNAEHTRTSVGWALHASGKSAEGYRYYFEALENLEALHRRAPSMRGVTYRLGKFHTEAAQIATALDRKKDAASHRIKAGEFDAAFAVN
jgi:serine/threonine protein kinase